MNKNLQLFFAIIAIIFPLAISSQVTINNSTFPVAGDTLFTIGASNDGGFDTSIIGADQEWDLTGFNAGVANTVTYINAADGDAFAQFPDADLLDKSENQEIYYQSFNNKIIEVGRSGLDPVLNVIELSFTNEGESILRRAPISFGDAFNNESSFSVTSEASIIPDTLIPDPNLLAFVDSFRLTVVTENEDIIDSWGTLKLPNLESEVLRMKRITTTDATLEVRSFLTGWVQLEEGNPITSALGDFADLLGETVTTSYQFYGNNDKEILANLVYDEDGVFLTAEYKGDITTSTADISLKTADVKTYPNPTYGDVTFELSNLPKGDYSVVLYNIIGKKLWSKEFDTNSNKLSTNLNYLRRGTYFYSILDASGRKIATKRIMIITP